MDGNTRGAVQLVDAIMSFVVLVALLVLAPHIYNFLDMVRSVADPFSATLMQLFVPFLFLAILISIGVSAKRGGV